MKTRLLMAVAAFLLLELAALVFSFRIAQQVEKDAVAINLAGRQRMLSQRITKAALLAADPDRSEAQRMRSLAELTQADAVFRQTLTAFMDGGKTTGGDERRVTLERAQGTAATHLAAVHSLLSSGPQTPSDMANMKPFAQFMDEKNDAILDAMNQLTTELERQSIQAITRLRIAQTLAFLLALGNFLFIYRSMQRAQVVAETASITDTLTGLLNRDGVYLAVDNALRDRAARNTPLGVMLLDLNDFKAVNDNFGHAAGDQALREVARLLREFCQPGWACGRLGGDEFAVVCPGLAPDAVALAARQLSQALDGFPAGNVHISASVGWASVDSQLTADSVMSAADAQMYLVKGAGRKKKGFRETTRQVDQHTPATPQIGRV